MSKFGMILTNAGIAKVINAQMTQEKMEIVQFAVGDANGTPYTPVQEAVSLRNEKWRGPVASVEIEANNPHWIVVTCPIPAQHGGFMIHEAGLYDAHGDLIAIGRTPESYKPVLSEGAAKDFVMEPIIEVSNASSVTLRIDPNVIQASRRYVDEKNRDMKLQINREVLPTLQHLWDEKEYLKQELGIKTVTETPIFKGEQLIKIKKSDGEDTLLTYDHAGNLKTVSEVILGQRVISTLHYNNGVFTHVTKQLGAKKMNYPSTLIASIDNYLINHANNRLYLSRDGGETYTETLDITNVGTIKYIHVFANGELLFCTHQKAYYSHDWVTYQESTVLDINGEAFVPTTYDNFTSYKHNHNRQIVDGAEMLVWGNYTTTASTSYKNINVWHTVDKGKTIKSCYKFRANRSDINNPILFTRHVHNVNFNPKDDTFWLTTGDHETDGVLEQHLLKGKYNTQTNKWTWELMGSGRNYKLSNLVFYEDYVYWAWDVTPGGVIKCPYNDAAIKDVSQHELILTTDMDCIMVYIGERGDMLVLQIGYGLSAYTGDKRPRYMYYSEDRVKFHKIEGRVPGQVDYDRAWYYSTWAPNATGKILSGVFALEYSDLNDWDLKPSIFLDDMLRDAGFPDAFKPLY